MKIRITCVLLVCFLTASFSMWASVRVVNNDHINHNLKMICGSLRQDIIVDAWEDVIIPLQGDHISGQQNDVCRLTVVESGDAIELEDLSVYVIDGGDIFEK